VPPEQLFALEFMVRHILTSAKMRPVVEAYAGGSRWVLLHSFEGAREWPEDFAPEVAGHVFAAAKKDIPARIALGLELRECAPAKPAGKAGRGPATEGGGGGGPAKDEGPWTIVIGIYNAKGIPIVGSCLATYTFEPAKNRVTLQSVGTPRR
jgi:hypothetical protein